MKNHCLLLPPALLLAVILTVTARASSHRGAPLISADPFHDGTDFYAFRSYEDGRGDFVTILANYYPLQDGYGGPNYFSLDPNAIYEIHIDNTGDAVEDIAFQFRVTNAYQNVAVPIGAPGNIKNVNVPLINVGPISAMNNSALNLRESYTLTVIRGPRRTGTTAPANPRFDAVRKRLQVAKAGAAEGFYRVGSDGPVKLTDLTVDQIPGQVEIGLSK